MTIIPGILLAGCAQPPPPVAFTQSKTALHSITVVTPAMSLQPGLLQGGMNSLEDSPVLGGAVAALVVGGIEMHRQNMVDMTVQSQGFSAQTELNTDIVSALRAKGYTVTLMATPRTAAQFLDYYPLVTTDAYLDVVVPIYGYGQQGFAPYTPMLQAQYRLVTVKGAKIVMQGSIAAYTGTGGSGAYQFKNVAALKEDPQNTVAGLRSELAEVAAAATSAIP